MSDPPLAADTSANVDADVDADAADDAPREPAKKKKPRGRPHGSAAPVLAEHRALRHTHFSFVRFVLEGVGLREAWRRCLAYAGGADDVRHIDKRLREICDQIRDGAQACGVAHLGSRALDDLARRRLAEAVAKAHREAAEAGERHRLAALAVDGDNETRADTTSAADADAADEMVDLPTLDEWVQERCDELGIEMDFQTQAEWLREYQEEFGEQLAKAASPTPLPPPTPAASTPNAATAAAPGAGEGFRAAALLDREHVDDPVATVRLRDQVSALNAIATLVAVPPTLDDPIAAWLSEAQSARLRTVGVLTLLNLADFIDVHGFRWHVRVDGLGAVRGARLVVWLVPILDELGRPLRDTSRQSATQLALGRRRRLAVLDPARMQRYGLVPLERLAVPPDVDGREGVFRVQGPNTFGVNDDLSAVRSWLRRYEDSPRTYRAYLHGVELFVLWCVCTRRKALSSLVEDDVHAFRAFLATPPADWIQSRAVERSDDAWRPLRGPLSASSQRHTMTVISALYRGLVDAGYVSVHVVSGVKPHMRLQRPQINVRRRFTEAQWSHLQAVLAALPDTPSTRRLRLVLELGVTTGLRLSELCTARMGTLRDEEVPGLEPGGPPKRVWLLTVLGKGNKEREVVIFDDVKSLIDAHQNDIASADLLVDAEAPLRSLAAPMPTGSVVAHEPLRSAGQVGEPVPLDALLPSPMGPTARPILESEMQSDEPSSAPDVVARHDPRLRPLVGALRRAVPRWRLDANGVATLDRHTAQADAYGAIDPSALYQSLKRLFARAGETAAEVDGQGVLNFDREAFEQASTHWLRHFFATTAAQDVDLAVLRDQMGHADLRTTSIYVAPERRALVAQMSKLRRRR